MAFIDPNATADLYEAMCLLDVVVSPALGGLVPGYETARQLGLQAMWVEREEGKMRLRRFDLPPEARVLIVEDNPAERFSIEMAGRIFIERWFLLDHLCRCGILR